MVTDSRNVLPKYKLPSDFFSSNGTLLKGHIYKYIHVLIVFAGIVVIIDGISLA
jgi:hypothetical protein